MDKQQKGLMPLGRDFYFKVLMPQGEIHGIECVRLFGDAEVFIKAREGAYKKDGLSIAPATREEYRQFHHWRNA